MNYGAQRRRQILKGFGINEDVIEKYGKKGRSGRKSKGGQLTLDFETRTKHKELKQKIEDLEFNIESNERTYGSMVAFEGHSPESEKRRKFVNKQKEELRKFKQ